MEIWHAVYFMAHVSMVQIFKDGKTIKVNINWLWDLKDVEIEGALHGMTVEAEMAGSSTSSHARREVSFRDS